jgi:hypothetical protein
MNIFSCFGYVLEPYPRFARTFQLHPVHAFWNVAAADETFRELYVTKKKVNSLSKINSAPHHEGVRGKRGTDQHILALGIRWKQMVSLTAQ